MLSLSKHLRALHLSEAYRLQSFMMPEASGGAVWLRQGVVVVDS
jgi:hypothetical protein